VIAIQVCARRNGVCISTPKCAYVVGRVQHEGVGVFTWVKISDANCPQG